MSQPSTDSKPGGPARAAEKRGVRSAVVVAADLAGSEVVRSSLQADGYAVATASPDTAVELLRSNPAEIIVLEGSLLPKEGEQKLPRTGHLLDKLRRAAPDAAIVILGGRVQQVPQAFARGAVSLIVRREDPDEVRAVIAQAIVRQKSELERLDALEEARGTRKFFEDVLRGLGEGIVVVDEQGRIRYRNPEAARILGEDDDVTPERGSAHGSLRLKQMVLAPLLKLLVDTLTEREPKTKMVAFEEEDQKLFLDVTTSVLRSGDGRATGAVAVVRDRSAEKLLEEQLAHTERLATLGSLLAAIAHEIANPLSVITGCAEVGQEAARDAAKQAASNPDSQARETMERFSKEVQEILDQVRDAGLRCQTIANNLLQYSRGGPAQQVVEQDLNELVKKTLAFVGKYLGTDKVEVALDFDPNLPPVKVDASQLQQALTNLIDNAVHAMLGQRKRSNTSSTKTGLAAPRLSISTRISGQHALITIADNGPGIPPRQLQRIWRPFYTTKQRGTGLGLYITKRAVEHQGGTISVETVVGEGTKFTISLNI